jgi:polysaccharide pyruvyl transferase WcaK-like protein
MKILITGAFSSLNKGDEARVKSTVKILKKIIPNAYFSFLSPQPETDRKIYKKCEIQIIRQYKYINKYLLKNDLLLKFLKGVEVLFILFDAIMWRVFNKLFNATPQKKIQQYDLFIDLSGESLSDYFGQIGLLFCLYQILVGILLKKRMCLGETRNNQGDSFVYDGKISKSKRKLLEGGINVFTSSFLRAKHIQKNKL